MKTIFIVVALLSLSACYSDREMSAQEQAAAYKACTDVGLVARFEITESFDRVRHVAAVNCIPPKKDGETK